MAKNKGASKCKQTHSTKKNTVQVASYREFLDNPQNQPEDTVGINNENLTGTDYLQSNESPDPQPVNPLPPPLRVRIKRFWEANGIWAVVITAALSFVCWTVVNIHNNDLAIERLTIKMEYIEKTLDGLDEVGINTEMLDEELADLKADLASAWKLDVKDIENRINIIELKLNGIISDLEVKSSGQS